jgi:hypothetical protein
VSILATCQVNDVISVRYGDQYEERIGRVVEVRDMLAYPMKPKSIARRPNLPRGDRLVTCRLTNGQMRAFYSGVEHTARRIPSLRAAFLYMRGKLPARKRV